MSVEWSDAKRGSRIRRVTLLGKTTEHADFDPKAFARAIVRSRTPRMSLAERKAWVREKEAELGRL